VYLLLKGRDCDVQVDSLTIAAPLLGSRTQLQADNPQRLRRPAGGGPNLACTSGFGGMVPGEAARLRLETTASTYVARDASTRKRAERECRSVRLREQLAVRKGLLYTSDTVRPTAALVSSVAVGKRGG
jgi:hypothetical protein